MLVAFSQPATGPSSVCEGSDVTLQCVIVINNPDNTTTVQSSVWTVAPDGILATTLPNHRVVFNSTTGGFTDLVITNVTLEDNNTVYSCTSTGAIITSSVVLNVTGNNCLKQKQPCCRKCKAMQSHQLYGYNQNLQEDPL